MNRDRKILIAHRIKEARNILKLKQYQMAELIGVSSSAYNNYEGGTKAKKPGDYVGSVADYEVLEEISKHSGLSASYLAGFTDVPHDTPDEWTHTITNGVTSQDKAIATNALAFSNDLLEEKELPGRELLLIQAQDDSMQPTIPHGGLVLVNQRDKDTDKPGVFCIRGGNGKPWFRRIRAEMTGGYTIFADDNTHSPDQHLSEEQLADLDIIGRYVGHWQWSQS